MLRRSDLSGAGVASAGVVVLARAAAYGGRRPRGRAGPDAGRRRRTVGTSRGLGHRSAPGRTGGGLGRPRPAGPTRPHGRRPHARCWSGPQDRRTRDRGLRRGHLRRWSDDDVGRDGRPIRRRGRRASTPVPPPGGASPTRGRPTEIGTTPRPGAPPATAGPRPGPARPPTTTGTPCRPSWRRQNGLPPEEAHDRPSLPRRGEARHDDWAPPQASAPSDTWGGAPAPAGPPHDPWGQTPSNGDHDAGRRSDPWGTPAADPWAPPANGAGAASDPWGTAPANGSGRHSDPWGAPAVDRAPMTDPWGTPIGPDAPGAEHDPWATSAPGPSGPAIRPVGHAVRPGRRVRRSVGDLAGQRLGPPLRPLGDTCGTRWRRWRRRPVGGTVARGLGLAGRGPHDRPDAPGLGRPRGRPRGRRPVVAADRSAAVRVRPGLAAGGAGVRCRPRGSAASVAAHPRRAPVGAASGRRSRDGPLDRQVPARPPVRRAVTQPPVGPAVLDGAGPGARRPAGAAARTAAR